MADLSTKLNDTWYMPHCSLPFDQKWQRINMALSKLGRISFGNSLVVYRDSGEAFVNMWDAVDQAKETVKWQTYICKDDVVGKLTMSKLQTAQERGVVTELLYDCGGNISGRSRLTSRLRELGATVIRHRPFFAHMWTYFRSGMHWELSPGIRNHRKILIVDRCVAFTGGLNIGDDYCSKAAGGNGRFRDTHCKILGPAVAHVHEVYEDTKSPITWPLRFARWRQVVAATAARRSEPAAFLARFRSLRKEKRRVSKEEQEKNLIADRRDENDNLTTSARLTDSNTQRTGRRQLPKRVLRQIEQIRRFRRVAASQAKEVILQAKVAGGRRRSALLKRYSTAVTWSRQALQHKRMRPQPRSQGSNGIEDSEPIPEAVELFGIIHRYCSPSTKGGVTSSPADLTTCSDTEAVAGEGKTYPPAGTVQILMSNPHTKDWSIQLAMWHVTRLAHRRLWITTPYYMPYRKLTSAIIGTAKRGVDVRIVAGSHKTTDPWFMWYASRYLTHRLLKAGVRVFEFDGNQIMHAKTVVVDSAWCSVGSYNWDMMSNKNMEVCATAFDFNVARQVESQFLQDLKLSREVTLEAFDREWWWCWRAVSFAFYQALRFLEYFTFRTYQDSELDSQVD